MDVAAGRLAVVIWEVLEMWGPVSSSSHGVRVPWGHPGSREDESISVGLDVWREMCLVAFSTAESGC
jgi:hypothetical protein